MAITRLSNSGIKTGVLKYDSMLAGNAAYTPVAFESIATLTGNGSATQLNFTSIPSTYKHLQIRGIYKDTSTTDYSPTSGVCLRMTCNNIGTTNYDNHYLYATMAVTAVANSAISEGQVYFRGAYMPSGASFTNYYCAFVIDIDDYASTSKNKTIRSLIGSAGNAGGSNRITGLESAAFKSTNAITSLEFYCGATAFASGTSIELYGIKG